MKSFEEIQAEIMALRDEKESKYKSTDFYRKEAIRENILSEQEQMYFAQMKREDAQRINFRKLKREIKKELKSMRQIELAKRLTVSVPSLRKWLKEPIIEMYDEHRIKFLEYFGDCILDPKQIVPEIEFEPDEDWELVG